MRCEYKEVYLCKERHNLVNMNLFPIWKFLKKLIHRSASVIHVMDDAKLEKLVNQCKSNGKLNAELNA